MPLLQHEKQLLSLFACMAAEQLFWRAAGRPRFTCAGMHTESTRVFQAKDSIETEQSPEDTTGASHFLSFFFPPHICNNENSMLLLPVSSVHVSSVLFSSEGTGRKREGKQLAGFFWKLGSCMISGGKCSGYTWRWKSFYCFPKAVLSNRDTALLVVWLSVC